MSSKVTIHGYVNVQQNLDEYVSFPHPIHEYNTFGRNQKPSEATEKTGMS